MKKGEIYNKLKDVSYDEMIKNIIKMDNNNEDGVETPTGSKKYVPEVAMYRAVWNVFYWMLKSIHKNRNINFNSVEEIRVNTERDIDFINDIYNAVVKALKDEEFSVKRGDEL